MSSSFNYDEPETVRDGPLIDGDPENPRENQQDDSPAVAPCRSRMAISSRSLLPDLQVPYVIPVAVPIPAQSGFSAPVLGGFTNMTPDFTGLSLSSTALWDILTHSTYEVPTKMMLVMVYSLPNSQISSHLQAMLQNLIISENDSNPPFSNLTSATFSGERPSGFSIAELSAVIQSNSRHLSPVYYETTSYLYAIQSAIKSYCMDQSQLVCGYGYLQQTAQSFCHDEMLSNHFNDVFHWLRKNHGFQHTNNPKYNIHNDEALINIWDIGGNCSVFHFLPALWGKLHNSVMWLFFNGERDANKLHQRFGREELHHLSSGIDDESTRVGSTHVMPYRTRLRYLLREAKLAQSATLDQPNCSIIGVFEKQIKENTRGSLQTIINSGTFAMGVDNVVAKRFEFCLYNDLTGLMKTKMDEAVQMLQAKIKRVPLKFLFLRSAYYKSEMMFVSRRALAKQAEKINISENEFQTFCNMFSSSGSIIDITGLDFIIMKPMKFICKLNDLFRHKCSDTRLADYGLLTINTAQKIFGDESEYFLQILSAVKLALKLKVNECILYDPTTKQVEEVTESVYYIPDVRLSDPDLGNHKDALLLRMDINCSLSHMQVLFAEELLMANKNFVLQMEKGCSVNVTKFRTGSTVDDTLAVQYLGEVVEFHALSAPVTHELANIVVSACNNVMEKDEFKTKYNFAVKCGNHDIDDRLAHPHHTVPYAEHVDHLLPCQVSPSNHHGNHWNKALQRGTDSKIIPDDDRLLEHRSIVYSDIINIAKSFTDLSEESLEALVTKLHEDVTDPVLMPPSLAQDSNFKALSTLISWQQVKSCNGGKGASTTELAEIFIKLSDDCSKDDKLKLHSLASKLDFLVFHTHTLENPSDQD